MIGNCVNIFLRNEFIIFLVNPVIEFVVSLILFFGGEEQFLVSFQLVAVLLRL